MTTSATLAVVGIGSAALSSLVTAGLIVLIARTWGPGFVETQLGHAGGALAAKVRAAVEEAADLVLPRIREQVREGFVSAADEALPRFRAELEGASEDALPKFREQVREGFKEALVDAASGGVIERAGEKLVERGGSVLETGLDILFGREDDHK